MNILLLSRYSSLGASSRLRFLQYLPHLETHDIHVTIAPLLDDKYVMSLYSQKGKNFVDIAQSYLNRIVILFRSSKYDLIYFEKELFPWLPAFAECLLDRLGIPYVVDYDDAIFHLYDRHRYTLIRRILGNKIDLVMRHASLVIVGNDYLEMRARHAGAKRVEVLPTVIDLNRYTPLPKKRDDCFTIGWIGTPVTERYMSMLQPVLAKLCSQIKIIKVILVGAKNLRLEGIPMQFRPWSMDSEVTDIGDFDVGIMPLPDEPWEHGKCGYKLIQYMACGKPVVASPIGINREIVEHGKNGFLANGDGEWFDALLLLHRDNLLRSAMGLEARKKVEKQYCIQVTAGRLIRLLTTVTDR